MAWRRRPLLAAAAGAAITIAGCGGGGLTAPSTPPPSTFEIAAVGDDTVELRYTGIGGQTTANFRVVLEGGGADGTYDLATVTDDDRWTEDDRYVLNQTTLGLGAPLEVETLAVELQYNDAGVWKPLVRANPAD